MATEAELKKLNQLRTFSKPFDRLSAGDEIDVPALKTGPKRDPAGQMLQSGDILSAGQ